MYAASIVVVAPLLNWTLLMASHAALEDPSSKLCSVVGSASILSCYQREVLYASGASTSVSLAFAVIFWVCVPRRYRRSFYMPWTYAQQIAAHWNTYSVQEQIIAITMRNPAYWPKEQARAFIAEHWAQWTRDQPAWFVDPLWRESLPAWALPDSASLMNESGDNYDD